MATFDNISEFVLEPGPEDCLVRCRVTRNSKGIDKGKKLSSSSSIFVNTQDKQGNNIKRTVRIKNH